MITLFTALYPEAKELITKLNLKKQPAETHYQLFESEQYRLVITGAGMISAATAAARHFANYPADSRQDIVINLGIAGLVPGKHTQAGIGDLFLVSKITEQATDRTFYPDLLYRHSFSLMPVTTTPVVCKDPSDFPEETLLDMEASALYQALSPHFFPDRMLFFKVVSDIPGKVQENPIQPEQLLAPHLDNMLAFLEKLQNFLKETAFTGPALTDAEQALSDTLTAQLPMTEAMSRDYRRLLSFAKLADKPLTGLLQQFLNSLEGLTIRGKKQAMPYLEQLRELILNNESTQSADTCPALPEEAIPDKFYNMTDNRLSSSLCLPFFSTIYAEKDIWKEEWQHKLSKIPIFIDHYKDIFNRSHQDFSAQKKAPSLILAKKTGTLIYEGAPVCQSFGNEHFYYTSCMMNCIYHCDYCYLQGMYPSGHVVVFVNLEDYFAELEALLLQHPVYLCISYDTDLLALEQTFSFVSHWLSFAAGHPDLTLEIRTKSGNPAIFEPLAKLFTGKEHLKQQIIFAWTVSPEKLCQTTEHGAASLPLRLKALQAARQAGFFVRLCFDPMIFHSDWKANYSTLVDTIFSAISAEILYDVSIGVFRISTEYLKNMRKKRPDSAIVQYPYITENGVSHYGALSETMVHYLENLLLEYLPADKIFLWNGGD